MQDGSGFDQQLKILDKINAAVKDYDPQLKSRAVEILLDAAFPGATARLKSQEKQQREEQGPGSVSPPSWKDFGNLYEAAQPSTDEERALVAGYYFQCVSGEEEVRAQNLNSALKDLGHGVGNITNAIQRNIDNKPAYMRQVKKSGKTQQSRKLYKVTDAGQKRVDEMTAATR